MDVPWVRGTWETFAKGQSKGGCGGHWAAHSPLASVSAVGARPTLCVRLQAPILAGSGLAWEAPEPRVRC